MPAHAGIHAFVAIKRAQLTPLPVIASEAKQSIFSTPKTMNKSQEQRGLVLYQEAWALTHPL